MLHRLAATKAAARLGTTSQRHQMLPAYPSSAAASQPAQPVPAEKVKILLEPIDLTPENFKPFGQVIQPGHDGKAFDAEDAQLCLDRGKPRFYIMRLPRRGLAFHRITFHAEVTQCLGVLQPQPWYMVVARPSGNVANYPKTEDLTAFRIPHGVSVKMERGTWHAGPLFDNADYLDFFNLELADTNITDHNTHDYTRDGVQYELMA